MPRICYDEAVRDRIARNPAHTAIVAQANEIIEDYKAQGFDLTLRQIYYQFVSRALIPNKDSEYDRLGSILNDARMAGLVDWEAIVDRTRHLRDLSHWDSPADIVEAVARQYRVDMWRLQPYRPEVWIEKDALVGVIGGVCEELDVPYFSCRGYTSVSELWLAAMRLRRHARNGQKPVILHFGDHDPSGIDMTRDIRDRLQVFIGGSVRVERLALNMNQIEQYQPPPNPAKRSDSRSGAYVAEYGNSSWELDALEPAVLAGLIRSFVQGLQNKRAWKDAQRDQARSRESLQAVSDNWPDVVAYTEGL